MKWWDRSNKTGRIGTLETSIARLASEMMGLKRIAEKTQVGVEQVQKTLNANHIAHATCETTQDARWETYERERDHMSADLAELTALVKANAENIRILSASLTRIADRQQRQGD